MFDKVTEVADKHDMTTKVVTIISDYACQMDDKLDKAVADVTAVKPLATEQHNSLVVLKAVMRRMEAKLLVQQNGHSPSAHHSKKSRLNVEAAEADGSYVTGPGIQQS